MAVQCVGRVYLSNIWIPAQLTIHSLWFPSHANLCSRYSWTWHLSIGKYCGWERMWLNKFIGLLWDDKLWYIMSAQHCFCFYSLERKQGNLLLMHNFTKSYHDRKLCLGVVKWRCAIWNEAAVLVHGQRFLFLRWEAYNIWQCPAYF